MTDSQRDTDTDRGVPTIGDTPFFVSSVRERQAGDRRRTMVTIAARPGTPPPPRPRPRPGPGRQPRRRPSPRPITPPVPPPVAVDEPAVRPVRPVRTSTRWPAALTLAALGLAVAVPFLVQAIVLLSGGNDDPPAARGTTPAAGSVTAFPVPTPAPTPVSAAPAALVSWAAAELAPDALVVTDAATAASLRRAGLRSAVAYPDAPARPTTGYVVDVPAGRDGASAAARALVARSLPLAVFPSGEQSDAATVRQLIAGSVEVARAAWRDNAMLRKAAGRELVSNRSLRCDDATRRALRAGALDLRVETVLGDLATDGTVRVGRPARSAAERRAGLPIRSIEIRAGSATAAVLRSMPADYRPSRVEAITPTTVRAVWPPTLPTASAVGNADQQVPLRVTEVTVR